MEMGGESRKPFGYFFSNLLRLKMQFESIITSEVLQLPMSQGKRGLNQLSFLHMLHLGDINHHSGHKKFIKSQIHDLEVIDDAMKVLHEGLLEIVLDESLSIEEQLDNCFLMVLRNMLPHWKPNFLRM